MMHYSYIYNYSYCLNILPQGEFYAYHLKIGHKFQDMKLFIAYLCKVRCNVRKTN